MLIKTHKNPQKHNRMYTHWWHERPPTVQTLGSLLPCVSISCCSVIDKNYQQLQQL